MQGHKRHDGASNMFICNNIDSFDAVYVRDAENCVWMFPEITKSG